MLGKNQSVFDKGILASTKPGKQMIRQKIFKSKGYRLFDKYKTEAEHNFADFASRFAADLHAEIASDNSPSSTLDKFADEVDSDEMNLSASGMSVAQDHLRSLDDLRVRVDRILDSNFVKMTFPVFNALYDGAAAAMSAGTADGGSSNSGSNNKDSHTDDLRRDVVEGHILAIDLSEPMDRIVDKDEDLEFLDDYRLMNPYILRLARKRISRAGDAVLASFEDGFRDARTGQDLDAALKDRPARITEDEMALSYKKYRAVMGTAGRNMALAQRPLGDVFYLGMAKAAEGVGCGNEIEDSIRDRAVKVPSWPLYYSVLSGSSRVGFEAAGKKGDFYLQEARLAISLLPDEFENAELLEFLFISMDHYNRYWYDQLLRLNAWSDFDASLPGCALEHADGVRAGPDEGLV